jgi:glycosyltransferase involved in cell wall biosynthesis
MSKAIIDISMIVPVFNEEQNVSILHGKIKETLDAEGRPYEIIFVDDGSSDGTFGELRSIQESHSRTTVIRFRRNFGQSAAMAAGFKVSKGKIVVTMDGDLQNDPKDIPSVVKRLEEGYDVVSGWRRDRKDKLFIRKVPSRIANRLICSITDVRLHDTGCALKAYRREVIRRIRLYGELHRFLPALARIEGARISEMVVTHHPRRYGRSKYNLTRTFRVLMDLSSLNLFLKYLRNPLRLFGRIGLFFIAAGILVGIWLVVRTAGGVTLDQSNVVVTLLFLLWVAGFQFLFIGLIGQLIVSTGERQGGYLSMEYHRNKQDAV